MNQYLDLLQHVLDHGVDRGDRTGTGTRSVFGYQMRFDLARRLPGAPPPRSCISSRSSTSCCGFWPATPTCSYLKDNGVTIWDEWADENGDLGPVYGKQWRSWPDAPTAARSTRSRNVLDEIRRNPHSRRLIVSAWNPAEVDAMALPPCHCLFQFYVADGRLSCQLYQRSADIFLGVPFNIASYALLTMMVAQVTGLKPGDFVHTLGDAHLYANHFEQAREQLTPHAQAAADECGSIPRSNDLFAFRFEDFRLENYDAAPADPGADGSLTC